MADLIHFETEIGSPTLSNVTTNVVISPTITTSPAPVKPRDNFSTPSLGSHTLFYLTVSAAHTDTYTIHGPVKKFEHLLPRIIDIVSNSPKAIDKLDALRNIEDVWGDTTPNTEFEERGFTTFVVDGQRGIYTVLKILREENSNVYTALPAPVYTVTAHGPLSFSRNTPQLVKGNAVTSKLIGSFVERSEAQSKAREVMRELVASIPGANFTETWGTGGKGSGVVMAMLPECRWEVRVSYEDEALLRAKEGMEREGLECDWRI